MSATQLKPLLASGPLLGDRLRDAAAIWDSWYSAEPSLATFTLHALLKDLIDRGWTDPQGIPTAQYQPFETLVRPGLLQIVDILAATPAAEPIDELDALVVAYRDSIRATP